MGSSGIDWNMVSAIGTILSSVVALGLGVGLPLWEKRVRLVLRDCGFQPNGTIIHAGFQNMGSTPVHISSFRARGTRSGAWATQNDPGFLLVGPLEIKALSLISPAGLDKRGVITWEVIANDRRIRFSRKHKRRSHGF